jgi:hypothetical protein
MIDWDVFRENYPQMTWSELVGFYRGVWKQYPNQVHFDEPSARSFFEYVSERGERGNVFELGGWQGHLARSVWDLVEGDWDNYEVCEGAVEHSCFTDARFHPRVPDGFVWQMDPSCFDRYSVLVASHVLEHLSKREVKQLLDRLRKISYAFIQSPLSDDGTDWHGYAGTHIYEGSWRDLEMSFEAVGFSLIPSLCGGDVRCFERTNEPEGLASEPFIDETSGSNP